MTQRPRDGEKMRKFGGRFFISSLIFLGALCAFAVNAFPQIGELESLASQIERGDTEQKRDALARINNLQTAAASRLAVPLLKDSSEIVRATAASAVVFLPPTEAAQILSPLLADKDALVRREAAYALGKTGDSSAVNSLLRALQKDKIQEVRNAAIIALGEIGDAAAISALVVILQKKPEPKEEFARRAAARSIGQIAQIIQTGKRRVVTPENFLPDRFKQIEKPNYPRLTESLAQFQTAVNWLIQTLQNPKDSSDAKREAAFALGAIGDQAAISVLQSNSNSEDYYLAEICLDALRRIAVYAEYAKIN